MNIITGVIDVCRLCLTSDTGLNMINIYGEKHSENIKEVIQVTTGVAILEDDLVSKKICQKCFSITLKVFQFRQNALEHDRALKEKLNYYLQDKRIQLPSSCITSKPEKPESSFSIMFDEGPIRISTIKDFKIKFHPTVVNIFKNYPNLKVPKKCFENHIDPIVFLTMGDVESYFKDRQLSMNKFTVSEQQFSNDVKKKLFHNGKRKTVEPLKINKKLFAHNPESVSIDKYYVYSPLLKKGKGIKRKIVSTDNDKDLNITPIDNNSEFMIASSSPSVTDTPEPPEKKLNMRKSSLDSNGSVIRSSSLQATVSQNSCKSISETTSENSTSNPESLDSPGLIPRVFTSKSQTLVVCKVCGSVHNSLLELKRHSKKHMICQFCKRKFRSLEGKKNHLDNLCEVRKVMNSPWPIVSLETVHLNIEVRRNYANAFSNFDPIQNLEAPASLEYDKESPRSPPLLGFPEPSTTFMPSSVVEKGRYRSLDKVKPRIKIKNSTLLDDVTTNTSDKDVVKDLIAVIRSKQVGTSEQMLQTDLPSNGDININNAKESCKFKNLKKYLKTYEVPVRVRHGPFNVSYKLEEIAKHDSNKILVHWVGLPVMDAFNKGNLKPANSSQSKEIHGPIISQQPMLNTILASPTGTVISPAASSSTPVSVTETPFSEVSPPSSLSIMPTTSPLPAKATASFSTHLPITIKPFPEIVYSASLSTEPTTSLVTNSVGLVTAQNTAMNLSINKNVTSTKSRKIVNSTSTLNSATPSLQNIPLNNKFPLVINNFLSVPKVAPQKNSGNLDNYSIIGNNAPNSIYGNIRPPYSPQGITSDNYVASSSIYWPQRTSSVIQQVRTNVRCNGLWRPPHPLERASNFTTPSPNTSKFRVKNVSELQ